MKAEFIIEKDIPALMELANQAHNESHYRYYKFIESYAKTLFKAGINDKNTHFAVKATNGDEIIGFFLGKLSNMGFCDLNIGMDDGFYVKKEHRGSKAAVLMHKAFSAWCEERGARASVLIHHGDDNRKTYSFCEKMGMIERGRLFMEA